MSTVSVYVIGPHNGPYKIGITSNVKGRLTALQISAQHDLFLYASREMPNRQEAKDVEKNAHRVLSKWALRGEWFDCPLQDAVETIGAAVSGRSVNRFDEIRDWLMETNSVLSAESRRKLADYYGIKDDSPLALADFRTAEIVAGRI